MAEKNYQIKFLLNDGSTETFQFGVKDGERGPQGPQGDKGEPGATGPKGDKGETGPQGERGATGPVGPQGIKGDTGEAGPKGDPGPVGADGQKGDKGEDGADGKSAYQYAQDGGYTGTEAEFTAKLAAEYVKTANGVSPDESGNVEVEGGGASSWNDLTDKPTVMQGGDTLTLDGNNEGFQFVEGLGYKISDALFTADDVAAGVSALIRNPDNLDHTQTAQSVEVSDNGVYISIEVDNCTTLLSVGEETASTYGVPAGLYYTGLADIGFSYILEVTIPGYTGFGQEKIAPSHLYQPDWNQNDATQPDYVKNRPFGKVESIIFPEAQHEFVFEESEDGYIVFTQSDISFSAGDTMKIRWGDEVFESTLKSDLGVLAFGNLAMAGLEDTGEPFVGFALSDSVMVMDLTATSPVTRLFSLTAVYSKKIDPSYVDANAVAYIGVDDSGIGRIYKKFQEPSSVYTSAEITDIYSSNRSLMIKYTPAVTLSCVKVGVDYNASDNAQYAVCYVQDIGVDGNADITKYYTAEYVPETT